MRAIRLRLDRSHRILVIATYDQNMALPADCCFIDNIEGGTDTDKCHAIIAFASLTLPNSLTCPLKLEKAGTEGHFYPVEVHELLFILKGARKTLWAAGGADKNVDAIPLASRRGSERRAVEYR